MNAGVHLCALLVFLALAYWVFVKEREVKLLRDYLRGDLGRRVELAWPLSFLSQYCAALRVPFEGIGPLKRGAPRVLQKGKVFEVFQNYGLDKVEYRVDDGGRACVVFFTHRAVSDSELWEMDLAAALHLDVKLAVRDLQKEE